MLNKFISRLMVMVMAVSCVPPDAVRAAVPGGTPSLDERYGRVIDGAYTGGDRLIVYVQDVHCNGGVQRNIHNIIQSFARAGNLRTVFVEGAPAGPVELRLLTAYPDGPAKNDALARMLDAGLLSGPEYGALTQGTYPLRGIEDGPLYDDNLQRLQRLMAAQGVNSTVARQTARAIQAASRRYQSRDIVRLERQLSSAAASKKMQRFTEQLVRHAAEIGVDLGPYPEFQRYQRLQTLARDIRQTATAARRAEQVAALQSLKSSFNPQAFYFEQRELAAALLARRARLPHEQDLLMLARLGGMFSSLAALKATVKDYDYFSRHEWEFYLLLARYCGFDVQRAALGILRHQGLMRYYAVNMQRDEHFSRSLLGHAARVAGRELPAGTASDALTHLQQFRAVDVVVAGGFHDGMVQRVRSSGVSFLTIMPAVSSVGPATDALYRQTMSGRLDIQRAVAAATAPRPGDASLVEQDTFTEKFFAELLILIQSEKRHIFLKNNRPGLPRKKRDAALADEAVAASIEASFYDWVKREAGDKKNHPLARLDVRYDKTADEWVVSFAGAEMIRAQINNDGTAITSLREFFREKDAPAEAQKAREQWESSVATLAESLKTTVENLIPSFIVRDSDAIDGFAVTRRAPRTGSAPQTIEEYLNSLSMDRIKEHVAANPDNKVEFIMGHNNPDNDALFSALIKAYLLTQYAGDARTLYVPLMCVIENGTPMTDEDGLATLTTEVTLACQALGLDHVLPSIIQSRHVARWVAEQENDVVQNQLGLTLVDVHDLPDDSGLGTIPRLGTDDHHPSYPAEETTDLMQSDQVHQVGATLSIIARWSRFLGIPLTEEAMTAMVRMMASGVLDDTKGLRSGITHLVDVFNSYLYARVAREDLEEMFRRQNTISTAPTPEQVVADRKDSYHSSVLIAHHMVRRVEGSDKTPFGVEYDMQSEIFAKMEDLREKGSPSRPFYNAFILLLTSMETGETKLWIATNDMISPEQDSFDDGKRTADALASLLKVLRNTYPNAHLSDVQPAKDGTRRYEISGLYGMTSRKEMIPLIKNGKKRKSVLDRYWPEGLDDAVEAAIETIAIESPRLLDMLFGSADHIRPLELIVDASLDDEALDQRRLARNSWTMAPGEHLSTGPLYTVSINVPLGGGRGRARVALVVDGEHHRISYWIRELPVGFSLNEYRSDLRSEKFRYRVAVAFALAMNDNGRAAEHTGTGQPIEIRYSPDFTPPPDIFLFPAGPLDSIAVEKTPLLDMDLIARMNAAA